MATVTTATDSTDSLKKAAHSIDQALAALTPYPVEYACPRCDDTGYIYDFEQHRIVSRCECSRERRAARLREWKAEQQVRLAKLISGRVDLSKTVRRGYMDTIGQQSVWLYGPAGNGKTHCAAWLIEQAILSAENPFDWGWYPIRKLIDAWRKQYDEIVDLRIEALTIMRNLEREEIVVIDDIDKIGTLTAAREEEFFNLIDSLHGRKVQLIVTSQSNIDAFCARMSGEALYIKRDKIGPQQRRLKEICKEIRL